MIPSIPPPYLSAPDKIANRVIKTPKINKMYLSTFLTLFISLFIYPKNPLVNVEKFYLISITFPTPYSIKFSLYSFLKTSLIKSPVQWDGATFSTFNSLNSLMQDIGGW